MNASEQIEQGYLFVIQPSDVVNSTGQDSAGSTTSAHSSDAGGDLVTKKFRELDSLITKKVLR